jgi:hypothetical protein
LREHTSDYESGTALNCMVTAGLMKCTTPGICSRLLLPIISTVYLVFWPRNQLYSSDPLDSSRFESSSESDTEVRSAHSIRFWTRTRPESRVRVFISCRFFVTLTIVRSYPGHEELELALLKTYEYLKAHPSNSEEVDPNMLLELADYFIEERGRVRDEGHYFEVEARARGEKADPGPAPRGEPLFSYHQADDVLRNIQSVNGHSVRAMYVVWSLLDGTYSLRMKVLAHGGCELGASEERRDHVRNSRAALAIDD